MEMAGRGFSGSYRFGYQGSEKDNEVAGDGNSYTTEFRQLDPRLGRWFSVDPVFQPWQSPYTSMDNNPIQYTDVTGQYIDNGDGTYSLENSKETVRGLHQKLVNEGKTTLTYDEFAKLNNIDRKTGFINGKGISLNTKFKVKAPAAQKKAEQNTVSEDLVKKHELTSTFNRELFMANMPSSDARLAAFVAKRPKVAKQIGKYEYGSNKISTSVVRFQQNTALPGKHSNKRGEGTHQNAFRHALWQATITRQFGANVAKEVGDAHEDVTNLNPLQSSYDDILIADEDADLRNNIIGRQIGSQNPNANMRELALKVLEWQYTNGLYNAVLQPDGKTYVVQVVRLTEKQYHNAVNIVKTTDEHGRTPEQQVKYNEMLEMEYKTAEATGLGL